MHTVDCKWRWIYSLSVIVVCGAGLIWSCLCPTLPVVIQKWTQRDFGTSQLVPNIHSSTCHSKCHILNYAQLKALINWVSEGLVFKTLPWNRCWEGGPEPIFVYQAIKVYFCCEVYGDKITFRLSQFKKSASYNISVDVIFKGAALHTWWWYNLLFNTYMAAYRMIFVKLALYPGAKSGFSLKFNFLFYIWESK